LELMDGGYPFAGVDMGYEDCKVGVEYDGAQHWTDPKRRRHDIDRAVELAEHGWAIVRVSADMVHNRPWVVVARTVDALRSAGCPWLTS
jgi:very-short-patch-repair endonuclease